jgi:hypothetical protein
MSYRYSAGELYGYDFSSLSPERIRELARASYRSIQCPFRRLESKKGGSKCNKKGGVCSLRQFKQERGKPVVAVGAPVVTCPNRFLENHIVDRWVGEILLGTDTPIIIPELPFLMTEVSERDKEPDAVGKIDRILVKAEGDSLQWCALEMQAVYFSGKSMENDFRVMRSWKGPGIPFPKVQRRPDFRSSGPKRLMPQLQIKVPTIRRWGKKMAVVVDRAFWESLSEMREVRDISNCEIVWFVVSFGEVKENRFPLQRHQTHFTTLSHAVEGLTGGTPMSLERFEEQIRARLSRA